MKRIVFYSLITCFVFLPLIALADQIDSALAGNSEVVLRAEVKEEADACDKYCWQKVRVLRVIKNESDQILPEIIKIAYYSWEDGIPKGVATIYINKYSFEEDGLWKLSGGKAETGVSHHEPEF